MRTSPIRMIVLLGCLAALLPAQAFTQNCPAPLNGVLRISADAKDLSVPASTAQIFAVASAGTRSGNPLAAPSAGKWTPSDDDIANLAALQASGGTTLQFADANGNVICTREFSIEATKTSPQQPLSPAAVSVTTRQFTASTDCQVAGAAWDNEIARHPGARRGTYTELVFLESTAGGDANVCYYNRDYGVQGDPIYVGVFSQNAVTWLGAHFEPCALQSAAPNVLQSSDKFPTALQGGGVWQLQTFLERRCFNSSLDVSIVGNVGGQALSQRYPLMQYDRYRGTVQGGVLFTPLHDATFALRSDQADTSKHFIYDRGPTNSGPEYVATLELYGILNYVPSLFGHAAYLGRDPLHDNNILDRLGAVFGVGITNPTKRFLLGASFEAIYGVSVVWVSDFAKISQLAAGVDATQSFKGTVGDVPTVFAWKAHPTFGVSMDLRYLSLLFTGNRQ